MFIFVSGGKTMGHISPLLSIILALKDKYHFVYFGLSGSMEEEVCKNYDIMFFPLKILPFDRKNILNNFKTFYLMYKETKRIKQNYKKVENKAIISTGGFVSIPLFMALKSKRKILLESNTTLGLANRFLSSKATYIGVNFDTIKSKKKVVVGNPIKIRTSDFDHPFFYYNDPLILFVGGSNGAFEIVKVAYEFNKKYPDLKIFVITGKRYYQTFTFNENARVFEKIDNLSSIFHKFKLVVSRAGAATITELLLSNSIFILVPSNNVSGNHQVLNAKFLEENGVCEVIYDISDMNYLSLIHDLLYNTNSHEKYRNNIKKILVKDSLKKVINLIEK